MESEIPAAMAQRLQGRSVAGELTDGGAAFAVTGPGMAGCRVVVGLTGDGWARVRLDTGGRELAPDLARLYNQLDYRAGELPSDHRWWSDVSGLLMLAELTAGT